MTSFYARISVDFPPIFLEYKMYVSYSKCASLHLLWTTYILYGEGISPFAHCPRDVRVRVRVRFLASRALSLFVCEGG